MQGTLWLFRLCSRYPKLLKQKGLLSAAAELASGYETHLCLSMGRAAVYLFFPFPSLPPKQIPNQAFESHSKKWTFSSVEKGGSRHRLLWCVRRDSPDGARSCNVGLRGSELPVLVRVLGAGPGA